MFPQMKGTHSTMKLHNAHHNFPRHERKPIITPCSAVVAVAVAACCSLNGCAAQPGQKEHSGFTYLFGILATPAETGPASAFRDMPPWIDLYREKNVLNVSTVDHVVIVTFETKGGRDEVYSHYVDKFGNEENFASFREGRDIISFVREGFGVKITLLDQSKNLWSLEYHRQMI
jgi:hypothetical protein